MSDQTLPPDWVERHSKSKNRPYYFNPTTGESVWEKPEPSTNGKSSATSEVDSHKRKHETISLHSQSKAKDRKESISKNEQRVKVSHILVKHNESRRPSSWKEDKITRTRNEALELIKKFRKQIESDVISFADLASKESDCNSASRGGDLGYFRKGTMQASFEDVAFALNIGELSEIVSTDSGYHILLRTG